MLASPLRGHAAAAALPVVLLTFSANELSFGRGEERRADALAASPARKMSGRGAFAAAETEHRRLAATTAAARWPVHAGRGGCYRRGGYPVWST